MLHRKMMRTERKRIDKKAQIMGMPFKVIFSVFLIAVFLAVAIYAIKYFIDIKNCTQLGLFLDDFQEKVDNVWNSQYTETYFSGTLPSNIQYVCFANLSEKQNAPGETSKEIFQDLDRYADDRDANLFLYPPRKNCMNSQKILHINITDLKNPHCIEVENGKVNISVEKAFNEPLVKIS